MKPFIVLLLLVSLSLTIVYSAAPAAKPSAQDKTAAEAVFSQVDHGLGLWGWQRASKEAKTAIAKLPGLVSSQGAKITCLVAKFEGEDVVIDKKQTTTTTITLANFRKAVEKQISRVELTLANPKKPMPDPTQLPGLSGLVFHYANSRGEPETIDGQVAPQRISINEWIIPSVGLPFKNPPPMTRLKLMKENGQWRLSELQVISYIGLNQ